MKKATALNVMYEIALCIFKYDEQKLQSRKEIHKRSRPRKKKQKKLNTE